MERKLLLFRTIIAIFSVVVIVIASIGIYSSFVNPLINRASFVDIPSKDQIGWEFKEDSIDVSTSIWINNTGLFDLEDVNLNVIIEGVNVTFVDDDTYIPSVASGENREVPLNFAIDFELIEEELKIEDLFFENTTFYIISRMTARYPYSMISLELYYDSIIEWKGIIETLEFFFEDAHVNSLLDDSGSVLNIPFEIESNDIISDTAYVEVTMWDENHQTRFSCTQLELEMGTRELSQLEFELSEEDTELFITSSQRLEFISQVFFPNNNLSFEYVTPYSWGAPLNNLFISNLVSHDDTVSAELYFENDSPRDLAIRREIFVYNIHDQEIGYEFRWLYVSLDTSYSENILVDVSDTPEYAIIIFYEVNTGMEYVTEVST